MAYQNVLIASGQNVSSAFNVPAGRVLAIGGPTSLTATEVRAEFSLTLTGPWAPLTTPTGNGAPWAIYSGNATFWATVPDPPTSFARLLTVSSQTAVKSFAVLEVTR